MGDHYIPQYYLRGFSDPSKPSCIWMYEKGCNKAIQIGIKNAACENSRWPREVEIQIEKNIESPSNPILDKIRCHKLITPREKEIFTGYILNMLQRVPRGFEKMQSLTPAALDSTFTQLENDIKKLILENPKNKDRLEKRLNQLPEIRLRWEKISPKEIWYRYLFPDNFPRVMTILPAMKWLFCVPRKGNSFLTCDNPVYYDEGTGIGKPESELSFPISSTTVLWATWKPIKEEFTIVKDPLVKEFNRRSVSNATKYVYYSKNEQGVVNLVNKKRWRLNRIEV